MTTAEITELISEIKNVISLGNIQDAIDKFRASLKQELLSTPSNISLGGINHNLIVLSSKRNELNKALTGGVILRTYYDTELSKISLGVLSLVSEFKQELENKNSELEEETVIGGAPSDSENVPAEASNEYSDSKSNIGVQLTLNKDFDKFSLRDQQKLMKIMQDLLNMKEEIVIRKVLKGSVILNIELPKEKYQMLKSLFAKGLLSQYDIVKLQRLNEEKKKPVKRKKSSPSLNTEKKNVHPNRNADINDNNFGIIPVSVSGNTTNLNLDQSDIRHNFNGFGKVLSVEIERVKFDRKNTGHILDTITPFIPETLYFTVKMSNIWEAEAAVKGLKEYFSSIKIVENERVMKIKKLKRTKKNIKLFNKEKDKNKDDL